MGIYVHVIDVSTNGSGAGTADTSALSGFIEAVELDFSASAGAGTTVDIDEILAGGLGRKILDKGAGNTDVTLYPRVALQDNTGTTVNYATSFPIYGRFAIGGRGLRVTVASGGASVTNVVRVRLIMEV